MDQVVFADQWQEYFGKFGLREFDDFYGYEGGKIVNVNTKRNVCRLSLGEQSEQKVFYMKRFHWPHLKDMVSAVRKFGGLTSQARVEWNNANTLLKNGIDTYKPVCLGEHIVCGIDTKSLVITEELKATSMLDYVVKRWQALGRDRQEDMMVHVGELVRKVHKLDISLPDLYIWHVFVNEKTMPEQCDLSLIDLHRMGVGVTSRRQKAKELGRLCWSLDKKYFDEKLRDILVTTYAEGGWFGEMDLLMRGVRHSMRRIRQRRCLADHYNRAIAESA